MVDRDENLKRWWKRARRTDEIPDLVTDDHARTMMAVDIALS
jgi:hypothetical protein